MSGHPLFRTEALRKRQTAQIGEVVLAHPLSFSLLTAAAATISAMTLIVLFCGEYTKKIPVSGQLVPNLGLATIYARQAGILTQRAIAEGQAVVRGDVLFEISAEMRSGQGDTHAEVAAQRNARKASLRDEQESAYAFHQRESKQQERRVASLRVQLAQLDRQITTQESQLALAEHDLKRYQELVGRNYLSRDALIQKESALLEQKGKLQAAVRERMGVEADRTAAEEDLVTITYRHKQQLRSLDRQLATEVQEYAESEATHRQVVVATQTGTIALINAEPGQRVDPSRPLATIVPQRSRLQAQFFVPSRAIGFIRIGTPVNLRYRTYPYQIFGLAHGSVSSVSKSALPARDTDAGTLITPGGAEPLFRITVELPEQVLKVQSKSYPLQTGMLVDADLLLERKRLYQWVIDPLYGVANILRNR